MSTESISDRREHIRSVSVTAMSALLGVGAALASTTWVGTTTEAAQNTQALAFVLGAILLQYVVINAAGIYGDDEFGAKHYLFVAFMTFSLWFVTWGILLTAEVTG
ncbi:hypothetical protein C488_05197 [Natrinema pellirubrum DSM 15624]|uniref:Uncharacterized protein n=1 Tax=Natrinema pellirubrum (strain DSM 15624 / CIP 106293 / JCM 10476 / NCIMB 786 / 157) TaxID=797303 RepID=L0JIV2_NATP1|nr:hypothetical protein [Natrinema pellirubrum]AGB30256.1 hypothetical protein Natpe_0324 [Natrinema pellirubrum DSM 15624]ELY78854.1 hypothetical protein C488_05197 [Natrinema pellirubrum DSM 15624]